jgi:hypothetical protein
MFSHKTKLLQGFAFCEFREGIFSDSSTCRCRGMLCDIYSYTVLCILSISATYPVVEACSVSFVSSTSLRRNPLRRIQMYKACSVPFVSSVSLRREFSTIHTEIKACLYPLYLFCRGILSNACGRTETCLYPDPPCVEAFSQCMRMYRDMPVYFLSVL